MTHAETLDLVSRWQTALDRRDVATFVSLYSEQASLESPLAGSVSGRAGIAKAFNAFFTAFPDARFVSEAPIVEGNRIAVVSVISGTDIGGLIGLPPSGKPFRFTIVFLLELADGLVVRDRRNYDFTGLLIQLGIMKAKLA